ncbi:MAG: hypothetical protein ACE5GD_10545 [Candidatus Geothermarchaeales archaeon]
MRFRRGRRGLSSIIGMLFVTMIFVAGFAIFLSITDTRSTYDRTVERVNQLDWERAEENVEIKGVALGRGEAFWDWAGHEVLSGSWESGDSGDTRYRDDSYANVTKTPDLKQLTQTADSQGIQTDRYVAQSFVPRCRNLEGFDLYVKRAGPFADQVAGLVGEIRLDSGGDPDMSSSGLKATVTVPKENVMKGDYSWVAFDFPGFNAVVGQTYWLVLRQEGDSGGTQKYYLWGLNDASDLYADGGAKKTTDGGSSWSSVNYDYAFRVIYRSVDFYFDFLLEPNPANISVAYSGNFSVVGVQQSLYAYDFEFNDWLLLDTRELNTTDEVLIPILYIERNVTNFVSDSNHFLFRVVGTSQTTRQFSCYPNYVNVTERYRTSTGPVQLSVEVEGSLVVQIVQLWITGEASHASVDLDDVYLDPGSHSINATYYIDTYTYSVGEVYVVKLVTKRGNVVARSFTY